LPTIAYGVANGPSHVDHLDAVGDRPEANSFDVPVDASRRDGDHVPTGRVLFCHHQTVPDLKNPLSSPVRVEIDVNERLREVGLDDVPLDAASADGFVADVRVDLGVAGGGRSCRG